jgi:hypothetical protein
MSHQAPDPLTIFPDQVMLENDASWLVFSVFPTMFDHHQIQRLGLISLFYNSCSRTNRSCSTSAVSSFSCSAFTRARARSAAAACEIVRP